MNEKIRCGNFILIVRKHEDVLIDAEDEPLYDSCKWYIKRGVKCKPTLYQKLRKGLKQQHFHRMIMNAPAHLSVRHINKNTLDCRKENLKLVRIGKR